MIEIAKDILDLAIPTRVAKEFNQSDFDKLFQSYNLAKLARDDFLAGELTWEEYLNLLELHQINIDSYLSNLELNLHELGLD